jgi:DNA polymerase-3 subunit delta'
MYFKDVIGQEKIKEELITEANEGRVSHAQMFVGPTGIGKLPLALSYARYLLCQNPQEDDACGKCHSCAMVNKLAHPDLHFVFPTVKTSLSDDYINEWRQCVLDNPYFDYEDWLNAINAKNSQPIIYSQESDVLLKKLSLKSFEGGYKVVIIWLPEKMQEQCANKLLKLIEEPPSKTVFLLVADETDKILPTIISRTQQKLIHKVPETTIAASLKSRFTISDEEADKIARLVNGNVSAAMKQAMMSDDSESQQYFNLFVSLMRLAYQRKLREMKSWSEQVATLGREKQKSLLKYCMKMVRESFIYNLHQPELNYVNAGEEQFVSKFSPFINESNIQGVASELERALNDISRNVNSKIVFFDFALKMIMLLKQKN